MNFEKRGDEQNRSGENDPIKKIMDQLAELDQGYIEADGVLLKPSQCYYLGTDPFHILFNTNCPDSLKQRIEKILSLHNSL